MLLAKTSTRCVISFSQVFGLSNIGHIVRCGLLQFVCMTCTDFMERFQIFGRCVIEMLLI